MAPVPDVIELLDDDDQVPKPRRRRMNSDVQKTSSFIVVDLTGDAEEGPAEPCTSASSSQDVTLHVWARPTEAITCPICFCDYEPAESVRLSACGHDFCVDCMATLVRGKVQAGEVLPEQIVCPCIHPVKCGIAMAVGDIQLCLPEPSERERYGRLTLQRCIENGEDLGKAPRTAL
eukprot:scaffold5747_cov128-Isochrysis_galbana.AAC.9